MTKANLFFQPLTDDSYYGVVGYRELFGEELLSSIPPCWNEPNFLVGVLIDEEHLFYVIVSNAGNFVGTIE